MKTLALIVLLVSPIAFAGSYKVTLSPMLYNEKVGYYGKVYVRNKEDESTQNVRVYLRLYQDEAIQPIAYDKQTCFATIDKKPFNAFLGYTDPDYIDNLDGNTGYFRIPELEPHQEFSFFVLWPEEIPFIYGAVRVLDDNNGYGSVHWPHHEISTTVKDAVNEGYAPMVTLDRQGIHSCLVTLG